MQQLSPSGPQVEARPLQLGGVPPAVVFPPAVPPLAAVPAGELVAPPMVPVTVVPPPPVPFIVTPCGSLIGVREQASPAIHNAAAIADLRHSQIIANRLSAKWSEGMFGAGDAQTNQSEVFAQPAVPGTSTVRWPEILDATLSRVPSPRPANRELSSCHPGSR